MAEPRLPSSEGPIAVTLVPVPRLALHALAMDALRVADRTAERRHHSRSTLPVNTAPQSRPVAVTIAGSDSGGGAGIQADLRTMSRLGVFGTTVITAVTAQNLSGVRHVVGLPDESVAAQLEAVLEGFEVRAAKSGMLWCAATVERIAAFAEQGRLPNLVVDPVMIATSGARLLEQDAVAAYESKLLPHAALVTPNLDEAALLLGREIARGEMRAAARELAERYGCPVLLKGGHLEGAPIDVLFRDGEFHAFSNERVANVNTHGSGCTLSAAIAAKLAIGRSLEAACEEAIAFLHGALRAPIELATGVRVLGLD